MEAIKNNEYYEKMILYFITNKSFKQQAIKEELPLDICNYFLDKVLSDLQINKIKIQMNRYFLILADMIVYQKNIDIEKTKKIIAMALDEKNYFNEGISKKAQALYNKNVMIFYEFLYVKEYHKEIKDLIIKDYFSRDHSSQLFKHIINHIFKYIKFLPQNIIEDIYVNRKDIIKDHTSQYTHVDYIIATVIKNASIIDIFMQKYKNDSKLYQNLLYNEYTPKKHLITIIQYGFQTKSHILIEKGLTHNNADLDLLRDNWNFIRDENNIAIIENLRKWNIAKTIALNPLTNSLIMQEMWEDIKKEQELWRIGYVRSNLISIIKEIGRKKDSSAIFLRSIQEYMKNVKVMHPEDLEDFNKHPNYNKIATDILDSLKKQG